MRNVRFRSEEHVESDWSTPVRSTMLAGVADVGVSEEEEEEVVPEPEADEEEEEEEEEEERGAAEEEEDEEDEEEAAATAAAAANSVKSDTGSDRGRRTTDNSGTV